MLRFSFIGMLAGLSFTALAKSPELTKLSCFPPDVKLCSAKSAQRLVVQAEVSDGTTADVSSRAMFKLTQPKIAKIVRGEILPLADGATELKVTFKNRSLTVPVQ